MVRRETPQHVTITRNNKNILILEIPNEKTVMLPRPASADVTTSAQTLLRPVAGAKNVTPPERLLRPRAGCSDPADGEADDA